MKNIESHTFDQSMSSKSGGLVKDIFQNLNPNKKGNSNELVKFLLHGTTCTPSIWEINKRKGVNVHFNKESRHGYSSPQDSYMEIGIKQVPEEWKQAFGLSENTSDNGVKTYIFSHENNHYVFAYMFEHQEKFPNFYKIYTFLKGLRKEGKGISTLGNMEFYDTVEQKCKEDFVELLNKYCIDPPKFKEYLYYLMNIDEVNPKNLYKIPNQKAADWLFSAIEKSIEIFITENEIGH